MTLRALLFLSIAALLLGGCRTNPRYERAIGLMRAEKLDLEDRYYELESKYQALLYELRNCQGQPIGNGQFERLPEPRIQIESDPMLDLDQPPVGDAVPRIIIQSQAAAESDSIQLAAFEELHQEVIPGGERPSNALRSTGAQNRRQTQGSIGQPTPAPPSAVSLARYIDSIVIDPADSGKRKSAQEPDREIIRLVVQPLDPQGGVLPLPGEITVSFFDPARSADYPPIATFEFDRDVAQLWVHDGENENPGIYLELTPERVPSQQGPANIVVRYMTLDGRTLETKATLQFDSVTAEATGGAAKEAPSETKSRWKPYR